MVAEIGRVFIKGGIFMTQLIRGAFRTVFDGVSRIKMCPEAEYQKHAPQSARQLAEENWKRVGTSMRSAMDKVREDNEPRL